MKNLVSFFWHGPPMSPYEQACIHSFVRQGFEVQVFTYRPGLPLSDKIRRRDAHDYFPEEYVFSYEHGGQKGSIAAFSDVMRYAILKAEGGWWCDTDVYCLRSLADFVAHFGEAEYIVGQEASDQINNAVLYNAPGAKHAGRLLAQALAAGKKLKEWGALGPRLITRYTREAGLMSAVQPESSFYPIAYRNAEDVLLPDRCEDCEQRTQGAFTVHLWNEAYRGWGLPKSLLPPKGSFLRHCMDQEQIEATSGEYPAELVHTLLEGFAARRSVQRRQRKRQRWQRALTSLRLRRPAPDAAP